MPDTPKKAPPPQLKERPFHNDWFFVSAYVLLALFIISQIFLIFWVEFF